MIINDHIILQDLEWDTQFFGIKSLKVILKDTITIVDLNQLKKILSLYTFISIENRNSNPENSQILGRYTNSFIADINIQFQKTQVKNLDPSESITIHNSFSRNNSILELINFKYSKFISDKELLKRGGDKLYHQWVLNSFDKDDKFYAISRDKSGDINGFLLYSCLNNNCVIELISVSQNSVSHGVGTDLYRAVESFAFHKSLPKITVGTQFRNIPAINFYNKMGFKQIGCHEIYHLWNL